MNRRHTITSKPNSEYPEHLNPFSEETENNDKNNKFTTSLGRRNSRLTSSFRINSWSIFSSKKSKREEQNDTTSPKASKDKFATLTPKLRSQILQVLSPKSSKRKSLDLNTEEPTRQSSIREPCEEFRLTLKPDRMKGTSREAGEPQVPVPEPRLAPGQPPVPAPRRSIPTSETKVIDEDMPSTSRLTDGRVALNRITEDDGRYVQQGAKPKKKRRAPPPPTLPPPTINKHPTINNTESTSQQPVTIPPDPRTADDPYPAAENQPTAKTYPAANNQPVDERGPVDDKQPAVKQHTAANNQPTAEPGPVDEDQPDVKPHPADDNQPTADIQPTPEIHQPAVKPRPRYITPKNDQPNVKPGLDTSNPSTGYRGFATYNRLTNEPSPEPSITKTNQTAAELDQAISNQPTVEPRTRFISPESIQTIPNPSPPPSGQPIRYRRFATSYRSIKDQTLKTNQPVDADQPSAISGPGTVTAKPSQPAEKTASTDANQLTTESESGSNIAKTNQPCLPELTAESRSGVESGTYNQHTAEAAVVSAELDPVAETTRPTPQRREAVSPASGKSSPTPKEEDEQNSLRDAEIIEKVEKLTSLIISS